jgi:hypothetical protein
MIPTCRLNPYRPTCPPDVVPPCLADLPYACACGCIWPSNPFDTQPCPDCHAARPPIEPC